MPTISPVVFQTLADPASKAERVTVDRSAETMLRLRSPFAPGDPGLAPTARSGVRSTAR